MARKIQRAWREHQDRLAYARVEERRTAAVRVIQRCWKTNRWHRILKGLKVQTRNAKATILQRYMKSYLARKFVIQTMKT